MIGRRMIMGDTHMTIFSPMSRSRSSSPGNVPPLNAKVDEHMAAYRLKSSDEAIEYAQRLVEENPPKSVYEDPMVPLLALLSMEADKQRSNEQNAEEVQFRFKEIFVSMRERHDKADWAGLLLYFSMHFKTGEKEILGLLKDDLDLLNTRELGDLAIRAEAAHCSALIKYISERSKCPPSPAKSPERIVRGRRGLWNLGNTCFMNSALQCMSNTPGLVLDYFSGAYKNEINENNPLGMRGLVAESFAELMRQMWSPTEGGSVSPRVFKETISRFAPQFRSYYQHDSQELLGFLLDGLHEDLNRVVHKPYVEEADENLPDSVLAERQWQTHRARNDSIIVDMFQGQYKSRVKCLECCNESVKFDPFMILSLPIPVTGKRISLTIVPLNGPLNVATLHASTVGDVLKLFNTTRLIAADVHEGYCRILNPDETPTPKLFAFELPPDDYPHVFVTLPFDVPLLVAAPVTYNHEIFINIAREALKRRYTVEITFPFTLHPVTTTLHNFAVVKLQTDFTDVVFPLDRDGIDWIREPGRSPAKKISFKVTLNDCFDAFVSEEFLEDPVYCTKCKCLRQSRKKVNLWRMPNILVVALKRFSGESRYRRKLSTEVHFPLTLSLNQYVPDSPNYCLYAVSNHFGDLYGGHYTAYAKSPLTEEWCEFDDCRVSRISSDKVVSNAAYVLFYCKINDA